MSPLRPVVLLCVLGPLGCGARSALDSYATDASVAAISDAAVSTLTCAPADAAAAPTCTTWQVAGPDQLLGPNPGNGSAVTMGAVIAVGCGVLVSWTTIADVGESSAEATWTTRAAAFDGTPTGPAMAHPSLTVASVSGGTIELAANANGVGALVDDPIDCRFLPLDATGADRGPVVTVTGSVCLGLTANGSTSFSYVTANGPEGATPSSLVTIDDQGAPIATRALGDPPYRAIFARAVFGDGSFLLDTFEEDTLTAVYSGWLQHFSADGTALSAPVISIPNAAPAQLAVTPSGALSSWWMGDSAAFAPVDPSGAIVGPVQSEPFTEAPYGEALASTPSGDVLVTLLESSASGESWTVFVQEQAPDGTPRGPLTPLPNPPGEFDPSNITPIVAVDGAHALLVYENAGVHALPLVCGD
jgi:hypothetical protein